MVTRRGGRSNIESMQQASKQSVNGIKETLPVLFPASTPTTNPPLISFPWCLAVAWLRAKNRGTFRLLVALGSRASPSSAAPLSHPPPRPHAVLPAPSLPPVFFNSRQSCPLLPIPSLLRPVFGPAVARYTPPPFSLLRNSLCSIRIILFRLHILLSLPYPSPALWDRPASLLT